MSRDETVGVAIVGAGVIGKVHAEAIRRHPRLRVAAVIDPVAARREELAREVERVHGGPRPLLGSALPDTLSAPEVDAVAVCTPSGLHTGVAAIALAAGKHVLVEKPADIDVAAARALVTAAREAAPTVTAVVSQHRFDPEVAVVRDAVVAGRLGRLTSAAASVAWWRSQSYYDSGDWRGTWDMDGGGALMNQSIHTVDLLLWLMGTPVEVFGYTALTAHTGIDVEDTVGAVIRFESGALATLHATTAAYPNVTNRLQVHGDRGSAVVDHSGLAYFHAAELDAQRSGYMGLSFEAGNQADRALPDGAAAAPDQFDLTPGHLRQYDDFVEAIETGRPPRVTPEDGLAAVAAVRAVYRSARLHRPVLFADVVAGEDEILGRA